MWVKLQLDNGLHVDKVIDMYSTVISNNKKKLPIKQHIFMFLNNDFLFENGCKQHDASSFVKGEISNGDGDDIEGKFFAELQNNYFLLTDQIRYSQPLQIILLLSHHNITA